MGPRTEPWGTPLTSKEGVLTVYTDRLEPVSEEIFDPVVEVTFDSITGELVQENLMIHFVEGFCVIKVDNITVVAFLEI